MVLRRSRTNYRSRLRSLADLVNVIAASPEPAADYERTAQIGQHHTRLKPNDVKRLVERYREGATTYELAVEFGCHRTTVSEALKRSGVSLRRVGLLPEDVAEAARLYESGLSLAAVGQQFAVTGDTVATRLRERGVRIRAPQERVVVL